MKVELHAHTHYSRGTKIFYDGIETPETMIKRAKQLGLGAIAITDHNTTLGLKEAMAAGKKHGILVIPGEEINSKHGHTLALGVQETIRPGLGVQETIDLIHAQDGIAIAVHPFDIKHDGLREHAELCDAIEVFNGINIDRISNIRSRKFAEKRRMARVAGSDAHTAAMIGSGIIKTDAVDVDGIIKSIKKGRISIECNYPSVGVIKDYSVTKLKMSYSHVWNYMDEHYSRPKQFVGKKLLGLVNKSPGGIDSFFQALAYTAFGCTVAYSFWRNNIRK